MMLAMQPSLRPLLTALRPVPFKMHASQVEVQLPLLLGTLWHIDISCWQRMIGRFSVTVRTIPSPTLANDLIKALSEPPEAP
jgi:hypothetical protein